VFGNAELAVEEQLMVNEHNIDTFCIKFRWDEAKYPIKTPLRTLVHAMQTAVSKVDEGARVRQTEWMNVATSKQHHDRKKVGSLRDRDVDEKLVKKADVIESENLTTLFVIVPATNVKAFIGSYETMVEFVVPRSAKIVAQEGDEFLYRVVLFKRIADDFRIACREQRYVVREFVEHIGDVDVAAVEKEYQKQQKALLRWVKTNFAEAFGAWIHVKAIRIFVESVLRYGPPARYETMLIVPFKKELKTLRSTLQNLFADLMAASLADDADDDDAAAANGTSQGGSFFPYCQVTMDLDLGSSIN
jgi:V-type H+-transporting ATPase subunit C